MDYYHLATALQGSAALCSGCWSKTLNVSRTNRSISDFVISCLFENRFYILVIKDMALNGLWFRTFNHRWASARTPVIRAGVYQQFLHPGLSEHWVARAIAAAAWRVWGNQQSSRFMLQCCCDSKLYAVNRGYCLGAGNLFYFPYKLGTPNKRRRERLR